MEWWFMQFEFWAVLVGMGIGYFLFIDRIWLLVVPGVWTLINIIDWLVEFYKKVDRGNSE